MDQQRLLAVRPLDIFIGNTGLQIENVIGVCAECTENALDF